MQNLILAALFAALTTVGAMIRIPLPLIPFTMQTFFWAFSAVLLGKRWGAVSQLVYIIIGLVGFPIFANPPFGGIAYVVTPTFGYLIGFAIGAYVVGAVIGAIKKVNVATLALACTAGTVAIYAIAIPYAWAVLNLYIGKNVAFNSLLWSGMLVFIPSDIVKICLVAVLAPLVLRRVGRASGAV